MVRVQISLAASSACDGARCWLCALTPPRRVLRCLALGLALALSAFATAQAQAPLEPTLVVTANARSRTLAVSLQSVPGAHCAVRMSDHGWARFGSQRLGASGDRTWRIAVPRGLAKAPWTVLATCTLGGSYGWRSFVSEMGFPERWGALVRGVAPGSAPQTTCDEQGLCFAEDPLEVGQCGWYALGRRPDLLPYAVHAQRSGEWLADAAGHLPEGTSPRVGALAIWSIGIDPPDGHVGYVAAVAGSKVLIDDSNWRPTMSSPGLQVHEHWVPASQPTGYIYPA
jgi:hypothetical protein